MSTEQKFPETIYQTHDDWGETVYADYEIMQKIISELRDLGDGWERTDISECQRWSLEPDGSYRLMGCRHIERARFVVDPFDTDTFKIVRD